MSDRDQVIGTLRRERSSQVVVDYWVVNRSENVDLVVCTGIGGTNKAVGMWCRARLATHDHCRYGEASQRGQAF